MQFISLWYMSDIRRYRCSYCCAYPLVYVGSSAMAFSASKIARPYASILYRHVHVTDLVRPKARPMRTERPNPVPSSERA